MFLIQEIKPRFRFCQWCWNFNFPQLFEQLCSFFFFFSISATMLCDNNLLSSYLCFLYVLSFYLPWSYDPRDKHVLYSHISLPVLTGWTKRDKAIIYGPFDVTWKFLIFGYSNQGSLFLEKFMMNVAQNKLSYSSSRHVTTQLLILLLKDFSCIWKLK